MAYNLVPLELNKTDFVPGAEYNASLFSKIKFEYLFGKVSADGVVITGTVNAADNVVSEVSPLRVSAFLVMALLSTNWHPQKRIKTQIGTRACIWKVMLKK